MRPTLRNAALAVALAATLSACGSGDAAESSSPSETAAEAGSATQAAVDIKDFLFVPDTLEIAAGSTVTFTNQDRFGHTATSGSAEAPTDEFDVVLGQTTDADTSGLTGTHTFDETGTFEYFCRYHPSMVGTIVVS